MLLLVVVGLTPGTAAALTGTNPILETENGELFIPFQPGYSGTLGDPLGGGNYVGLQSNPVQLCSYGATSSGWVSFVLTFDLSADLGPGEVVDPVTAGLRLTFDDIDFKPYTTGTWWNFRESLELTFLQDATDAPGSVDLAMDNTNYGLYAVGGFVETNNQVVVYELSFQNDLGVTQADFDDMSADKEFGLYVTFFTHLTHLGYSCHSIGNTSENVGNSFDFVAIPEPATMTLAGFGILLLLARRKRR